MKIKAIIRQWWADLTITPAEAAECKSSLEIVRADVHSRVDQLETPEQIFARIRERLRQEAN